MENKNENQEFELSLASLFKIFKGKLKKLVIFGLVAAILGGSIGALSVVLAKKSYGNTLTFYFPTPEKNEYKNVLPLLESDNFAENVLIGTKEVEYTNESGKTVKVDILDLDYTEEQEKDVAKYEYTKLISYETIKKLKELLKELPSEISILELKLNKANSDYTLAKDSFDVYMSVNADNLAFKDTIAALEVELEALATAKKSAFDAHNQALSRQKLAEQELLAAEKSYEQAIKKSNDIIGELRAEWLADKNNKKLLATYRKSVSCSISHEGSASTGKDGEGSSFVYVNVSVLDNEELANRIIENVPEEVSDIVIANSTPFEPNDVIECKLVSSARAIELDKTSIVATAAIFAVVALLAVEIILFIAIVLSYFKKTVVEAGNESKKSSDNTNE
jgi:hypothetical protein